MGRYKGQTDQMKDRELLFGPFVICNNSKSSLIALPDGP